MPNFTRSILITLFAFSVTHQLKAQNKKDLTVSIGSGIVNSSHYPDSRTGKFYIADFDYQLTKKSVLSVNLFTGGNRYTEDVHNTDLSYSYGDGTNAKVSYMFYSILYKYRFLDSKMVSCEVGSGFSLMTLTRESPFYDSPRSVFPIQSTFSDLAFPLRLEVNYKIAKGFRFGVLGGAFIEPDYPVLAYHAGFKLGYTIH